MNKACLKLVIVFRLILIIILLYQELPATAKSETIQGIEICKDYHNLPFSDDDLISVLDISRRIASSEIEKIFVGSIHHPMKYLMCRVSYKPIRNKEAGKEIQKYLLICRNRWNSYLGFKQGCNELITRSGWVSCESKLNTFVKEIFSFYWGELVWAVHNKTELTKDELKSIISLIRNYTHEPESEIDEDGNEMIIYSGAYPKPNELSEISSVSIQKSNNLFQVILHKRTGRWSGLDYLFRYDPIIHKIQFIKSSYWVS